MRTRMALPLVPTGRTPPSRAADGQPGRPDPDCLALALSASFASDPVQGAGTEGNVSWARSLSRRSWRAAEAGREASAAVEPPPELTIG
jgi:hypothetical protein